MKKIFFTIAVIIPILAFGQDYKLFHAGSKKLFSEVPTSSLTIGMAFDSVTFDGSDSVYHNYTGVEDNWIESDTCFFWAGPHCNTQSRALCFGPRIIADSQGRYHFLNQVGDSLHFDFTIQPGDTSVFFMDASQKFSIIHAGADTTSLAGYADSARFYRIAHTDMNGIVIPSLLHNKVIVIGEKLGLMEFFTVLEFPTLLQWVKIIGNSAPEAGLVRITNEMLYDHQPGDVIQYRDSHYSVGGPPWMNYTNFWRYTYLDRTESPDSLIYKTVRHLFALGENTQIIDTIFLRYKKGVVWAEIPFDRIDQSITLIDKSAGFENYCGITMFSHHYTPKYRMYCAADNCWGIFDTQGPPPIQEIIHVSGLGLYKTSSYVIGPPPQGYSEVNEIIYFRKNGMVCGNEAILGINDQPGTTADVRVYPNPAQDILIVELKNNSPVNYRICNMQGQIIQGGKTDNLQTVINISSLQPGIYLLKLNDNANPLVTKFIKQ